MCDDHAIVNRARRRAHSRREMLMPAAALVAAPALAAAASSTQPTQAAQAPCPMVLGSPIAPTNVSQQGFGIAS